MHNDCVVAFGDYTRQILLSPLFAINFVQVSAAAGLGLGPGDLFVHHAIALGLHTSSLALAKGSLDSRFSKLMPDKAAFGTTFACDGPGRGGTCDVSAWDAAYLAVFWVLNTCAWFMFYFHWRTLSTCESTAAAFTEATTTLNGWFSSYLWFSIFGTTQRLHFLQIQRPLDLDLDLLSSTSSLGNWVHVSGLLAWLLAGTH